MSTTNADPGDTLPGTSDGVPPTPEAGTPATVLPLSDKGGQTAAETNGSNMPNSTPVSPPATMAGNANLNPAMRQILQNGSTVTWPAPDKLDVDALEKGARRTGTYTGALIMTAAAVPIVAAVISAIAFVVQWPKGIGLPDWLAWFIGTPLLLGTVPTLIVWLLLAFIIRRFTAVDRMNMSSYGLLLNRLSTLDAQLGALSPEPATIPLTVTMASKEALDSRNTICKKLVKKGLGWVTAMGYITLWKEMHNAEEALIDMMPREVVIADALYDELRIQDSNIDTRDELLKKLRMAVTVLDPSAEAYLQSLPSSLQAGISAPPTAPATAGAAPVEEEMQPRSVLREVRHALNEFRDDRWEAIVRVRNQFVCTTIVTGLTMYVLLQFALLAGVPQPAIISVTAFYLVGGLVGLVSRLNNESQTSKSIDDYRLALVRLVATPLYSGLAAVGGVLVTQKFTSLVDIFDPKNILSGLIVAAAFGLTPSLLMNTLQKQTETYKTDLKSTAATQGQGAKTP